MNKFLTLIITTLISLSTCSAADYPILPATSRPIYVLAPPAHCKKKSDSGLTPTYASSTSGSDSSSDDSDSDDEKWDRTVVGGMFELSPPRKPKKASFDFVQAFMNCFVLDILEHMIHAEGALQCAQDFGNGKASCQQADWVVNAITTHLLSQPREKQALALQCAHFALAYNSSNRELASTIATLEAQRSAAQSSRLLALLGDAD